MGNKSCPDELKFYEVSQTIKTKEMLKISDFCVDKQKIFIPPKDIKCTMDSSFFSLQMAP